MLSHLLGWYGRTFLPFEQSDHPLYHDQAAVEAQQAAEQALWEEVMDAPYQISFTVSSDPETTHYL